MLKGDPAAVADLREKVIRDLEEVRDEIEELLELKVRSCGRFVDSGERPGVLELDPVAVTLAWPDVLRVTRRSISATCRRLSRSDLRRRFKAKICTR